MWATAEVVTDDINQYSPYVFTTGCAQVEKKRGATLGAPGVSKATQVITALEAFTVYFYKLRGWKLFEY
jgi:hypothetical protein